MQLHLIRHTTPEIEKGICYGWSDIPLKKTFEDEAKKIMDRLPKEFDALYTSPLKRCYELARKINQISGVPLAKDDRLKELNFGEWEMQKWDGIDKNSLNAWMENYESVKCPGGESYRDMQKRVNLFLAYIRQKKHKHIVVTTHGGVIRAATMRLQNISLSDSMNFKVDYGSMITYTLSDSE